MTTYSLLPQKLKAKSDLTDLLDKLVPEAAVLDIAALSLTIGQIITSLGLSEVLQSPDVATLRYYRREAVGILSEPVSSQGGYTRRHVLEALYARLTGAAKSATLKELSTSLPALSDKTLLQYTFDLLKQMQVLAGARLELNSLSVLNSNRTMESAMFSPKASPVYASHAPGSPMVRSLMAEPTASLTPTLSAWPMPSGATLLLPANHPAFTSSEAQEELLTSVKKLFNTSP